jgi:arsenate reductase
LSEIGELITLYGIKNCDTVRKARRWLEHEGIAHHFHDMREQGLTQAELARWCQAVGWEALLNRRSATWRALPDAAKAGLDGALASDLMLGNPTLIRRPVLESDEGILVGFSETDYARLRPAVSRQ